ncbi:MAG TPA: type II secretion system protein [Patescibacteria group bacterium]
MNLNNGFLKRLAYPPKNEKGFTLIELIVSISIIGILLGLVTINLLNAQHKTNIATSEELLIADLRSQQIKAMNGINGGGKYGVHFSDPPDNTYTVFQGNSYASATDKSTVSVDGSITFSGSDILFDSINGEVDSAPVTISIKDTVTGVVKSLILNKYGVVTGE